MTTKTKKQPFPLGQLVATGAIGILMMDNQEFNDFLQDSLDRYVNCDWGDCCEGDTGSNDEALELGNRILAVYNLPDSLKSVSEHDSAVWCITESDRSVTTLLWPSEY